VCTFKLASEWESRTELIHTVDLWISENEVAPKYKLDNVTGTISYIWHVSYDAGIRRLAELKFDLKRLPPSSAIERKRRDRESYYKISYDLVIFFRATLGFEVMVKDTVYGAVIAKYV
jgi:hypothetical protein